ncbi:MAG: CHASE3 domain-containing protein [Rhodospirillales bacterium]
MPDSAATLTGGEPDEGPVPGNFSPRPHAETRLRARTFTPIAGSLALLLGICAAAAYLGIASQREAASAAHEEMIEQTVGALQDQLLAAESGQRGFLVTDRVSYLAPFLAAVAPIEADMDRLDTLVAGNQARTDIAHVLREHVQRKLDEMRDTISMVRGNKEAAARTLVNSDLGGG